MKTRLATVALLLFSAFQFGLGCSSAKSPKRPPDGSDPPNMPCDQSRVCKVWGWCEEKGGECVAGSNEQCRASEQCKQGGLCSLEGNKCVAKDGDCDSSDWCKKNKLCTAREGVCK